MIQKIYAVLYFLSAIIIITAQILMFFFPASEKLIFLISSSYKFYLIPVIIFINAFLVLCLYKMISCLRTEKTEKKLTKFKFVQPFLDFLICMVIFISIIVFFNYSLYKKAPTAPEKFIYTSEPFIQASPGINGEMKSLSENISIWWFSSGKKSFVFKSGKSPDEKLMTRSEIKSDDNKRFQVDLTGLEPSQKYYYIISGLSGKTYNFRTAPAENSTEEIRILSVGDNRTGKNRVFSFYNEINSAANSIYRISGLPSFKMNCGDVIHNGNDFYSWKFFLDIEKIHSPYILNVISIGNHELYNDAGANYDYMFNLPRYYSFSWGRVHVINLNPYDGILNTVGREQYNFVKDELEKHSGKKWIIIQLHTPIISTGDYNMNRLLIAKFFELFRKYKVDLVIAGHDHHFDSFLVDGNEDWGGIYYIVNGGGGSKLDTTNMTRKNKIWKTWIHDRNSKEGLYQNDEITKKYHIYSESAWGFADIRISPEKMTIDYYRWLDIEKYLDLSKQNIKKWNPMPLSTETINKEGLEKPVLIKTLKKKRIFQR